MLDVVIKIWRDVAWEEVFVLIARGKDESRVMKDLMVILTCVEPATCPLLFRNIGYCLIRDLPVADVSEIFE